MEESVQCHGSHTTDEKAGDAQGRTELPEN